MRFSTALVALAAPFLVSAAPTKHKRASDNDKLVLQFAEVLERLETEFYEQALAKFVEQDFIDAGIPIADVAIQNFQAILEHEKAHTQFLDGALAAVGAEPLEGCTFNFDTVLTDVATMAAVARVVEAVGVGAYLGASSLVDDKNVLLAAASILTIEARHQSFLNTINGATSVPQAFDLALRPEQVLALAGGFISGCSFDGITANTPLSITNTGPIAPGTLLEFDTTTLDAGDAEISCQMVVAGEPSALSFPIAECIVPNNVNGPVAIFLTTNNQPLAASVLDQDVASILAGPSLAFLDITPDALGALVRSSGPLDSSEEISQGDAQDRLDDANGDVSEDVDSGSPDATSSGDAPPAESTGTPETPENSAPAPATPPATPPVKEIGHSTIPA